ncbi:hypothetical protein EJ06DRAFT_477557 [Trichodelitschia bisporula]|uniref:Amino acid transporter transmembrane domain-containing protein n=1 Tax=Trichodelitschia bisporula TaxID=703511 RepID=A0A6G1HVM0_9PEZI|nr:hypothetical protein EJ06DRAFT_477557 [Trichodelitschia bisporula]
MEPAGNAASDFHTARRSSPPPYDSESENAGRDAEKHELSKQVNLSPKWQDPFADEANAEVKYRSMDWWQAAALMIAETVSLGILSLPSVLATVGFVPGIILIVGLGALATYTGYVIGQFKAAYPHVVNMADVGEVMLGAWGREIGGASQTIFLVFVMGSHVLTFNIAMNTITQHRACTIVWGVVGLVLLWVLTLPRTLKKVSYLSIVSFISIITAVLVTMIGVGIKPVPDRSVQAFTTPAFVPAFLAAANIIFAFAGHVAFFSFISELKTPEHFPKALYLLQVVDTAMYVLAAALIYAYTGSKAASPALGNTGPTLRRIAYGLALPTIIIAGVIYGHVASKYIYVRMFRGTKHLSSRTWLAQGSWGGITLVLWVLAWVIAQSIPNFNQLIGLITSIFASWFTYGLSGVFWLYLNKGHWTAGWKKSALTALNLTIVALGAVIMALGLWTSGVSIANATNGKAWSCADNAVHI